MLILNRKVGEVILIEGGITITVLDTGRNRVRLGIQAPDATRIQRAEIADRAPDGLRYIDIIEERTNAEGN